MKFIIKKTSHPTNKPCSEARLEPYLSSESRDVDSPEKLKNPFEWYETGSNHRLVNGQITRDHIRSVWTMDMNNLDDLLAFQEKVGEIIIYTNKKDFSLPIIEIYDDLRE